MQKKRSPKKNKKNNLINFFNIDFFNNKLKKYYVYIDYNESSRNKQERKKDNFI